MIRVAAYRANSRFGPQSWRYGPTGPSFAGLAGWSRSRRPVCPPGGGSLRAGPVEGQKCSTSRRHGLWLRDLLAGTSISSDELRFVLADAALDHGTADLTLHGLAEAVTSYRQWAANTLPAAADHAPAAPYPEHPPLRRLVDEQHAHLDPGRLDLPAATRILHTWMRAADRPAADWLLGLALLGEPIIPDLARHAWTQLGHTGSPTLHAATSTRPDRPAGNLIPPPPATPLTAAHLRPFAHTAPPPVPAGPKHADPTEPAATVRYRWPPRDTQRSIPERRTPRCAESSD